MVVGREATDRVGGEERGQRGVWVEGCNAQPGRGRVALQVHDWTNSLGGGQGGADRVAGEGWGGSRAV